jgi:nucleoside-triphosphate--adenylate kinase
MKNILLLGRPGSGKGTVAKKLLNNFNLVHLSTGDLLRAEIARGSQLGKDAQGYMQRGEFVPDETVVGMVKEYMVARGSASSDNLLLDGFPRKLSQAQSMESFMRVSLVINLDIPVDVIVDRISKRWVHERSGRIYNLDYNPPASAGKDDLSGEALVQRPDDKPEVVLKRLAAFDVENDSIIKFYSAQPKSLLRTFSGTETDKIYPSIENWLRLFINNKK